MRTSFRWMLSVVATTLLLGVLPTFGTRSATAAEKQDYTVVGEYVEGCSCTGVCPCELTGVKMGCLGVGAMKLTSGSYMGVDLSGAKIAYATMPGSWVRVYVDASSPEQSKAAKAFARAVYTAFGKVEAAKDAKISMSGTGGRYQVTVNGGRTMRLSTVPVLGGDKTTPITHTNTKDLLNHTMMQGKTVSGSYHDGPRSMTLKGSNSYFNDKMDSSGQV
ncbi:MAG TPA: DUF1326 domain-containing protein [Chthonomonadaceae bacterium]|nr:DUF1326 domain-containing protein [Chthonomonadaceae bacterium]